MDRDVREGAESLGGGARVARYVLLVAIWLFVLGAFAQFFLVGLGMFDSGERWKDHETLGHVIGEIAFLAWIPAALGRAGRRLVLAAIGLGVLFLGQYLFINNDEGVVKALHPVNGALMLALALWIAMQALRLVRPEPAPRRAPA